jgi:glycosyltransferase involved in cell wall biosynthesis
MKNLSVFFPAYNEEENIESSVSQAIDVLKKLYLPYEVIIVDDGSTDRTGVIADRLAAEIPEVRAIHHRPNRGYGGALRSGFENSRYEWVAFTDADGQFDFAEIKIFLPLTESADLILGYRRGRADSLTRKFFTWGWSLLPRILWGLNVRDYSCGFKLIKKEVYGAVRPIESEEKVFQIEFLVKAKKKGFRFAEVGVSHYPRKKGSQTGANLKVTLKSLREIFALWRRLK